MKKSRALLLSGAGLALAVSLTALVYAQPSSAETSPRGTLTRFITLSVDMKLLDVGWRCESGACRPWFLTQAMRQNDVARMFTLTGGDAGYVISETRSGPAWPRAGTSTIMTLPVDQRLLRVNWVCQPTGCALSLLTRTMQRGDEANGYVFTDGDTEYFIQETRE